MAKILIVEDNQDLSQIYKSELEYNKFEVMTIPSALEFFSTLDEFKPDLILLDIMLPDGDGIDLLKKVKGNPKYKMIKVVPISNIDATAVINDAFASGADGYLIKNTILPSQLTDEVKNFLK